MFRSEGEYGQNLAADLVEVVVPVIGLTDDVVS
jgi:hypothetical protein